MGEPRTSSGRLQPVPTLLLAAVAVGVGVRALLLALPPLFVTDVFYYNAQGVGYLLRGVDPYGASYSVPASLATPGAETVFAYLPGVFAFLVPGAMSAGSRLGLVACDVVVAACLALFRPKSGVALAAFFLLLPPTVLLSTAFLNDSLPSIALLSMAVLLEARDRHTLSAILVGLALASSQETWLVFPVYVAYCARNRRMVPPLIAVAVGVATLAPFALWNLPAFVSNTLLFQFQRPVDAFFSLGPFGMAVNPSLEALLLGAGISAPLIVRGGIAGVFLAFLLWRSGPETGYLLWGSAASAAVCLFLLAGNFFWSYLELPSVLLLFWVAPRLQRLMSVSTLKE